MPESVVTPTIGATGLLALVVLLILWGKLVPRSHLDDLRADKDQQIAYWRAAFERAEAARDLYARQARLTLELARTSAHVLESLPDVAGGGEEGALVPAEAAESQS